jgi:signal transduction histidine kinase
VTGTNDVPTVEASSVSTTEESTVSGSVSGVDVDGTIESYAVVDGVGAGNGELTFSSDGSYSSILAGMLAHAQSAQVALRSEIATDLQLLADPDLIKRVIENLLDNAIRHAPEHSTVTITGGRAESGVELRIADAGVGIPADHRDKVFERFVQTQGSGRSNRGLGLSFCKLAVEAHRGRIWIEEANPGAKFCLWLPDAK